ncbi:MAG: hypothetical protein J7521_20935 [Caulobacter sp.]|nr:hypothetical protein [Caulobacter sp.]
MGLYYSPSLKGFFDDALHASIPDDAVKINKAAHTALMTAQASGRPITFDAAAGKPVALAPPEPLLADRRAQQLTATRVEAGRRIEAITPLWRQSNDNAVLGELAWRAPEGLSDDEAAQLLEARQRRAAIDAVRQASDALEAAIGAMTVAQLKALDVTQADHWPAAPSRT